MTGPAVRLEGGGLLLMESSGDVLLEQTSVSSLAVAATNDTSNGTSYVSNSWTPAAGDHLTVFVVATETVAATPTLTDSANGIQFILVGTATWAASAKTVYVYVCDRLAPLFAASMTVTFDCTADAATGASIMVMKTTEMSRTGLASIRQWAADNNESSGTAPAPVFAAAALTDNVTALAVGCNVSSGTLPPAGGWAELADVTYATPTTGASLYSRDSGFTGTTITLGSTTNGNCCGISVELDTSLRVDIPYSEDFESTQLWTGAVFGWDTSTPALSTTYSHSATHSLRITFPTNSGSNASGAGIFLEGFVPGQQYDLTLWGRADTGQPDWHLQVYGIGDGSTVTTKNAMTSSTYTFTATQTVHFIAGLASSYSVGNVIYFDDVTVVVHPAGVDVNAENAAATGAAQDGDLGISTAAEATAATGAANDATANVQPAAAQATATGTANDAVATAATVAEVTAATGTAPDPTLNVQPNAENAAGTGTAYDATISTAVTTNVNAENAAGTGTANDATLNVGVSSAQATATGAANDAALSLLTNAESPGGTGAAGDATSNVGASPTQAAGTGAANDATPAVGVNAAQADAIGAAGDAQAAIAVNAENAAATGTAYDATISTAALTNVNAEVTNATGTAPDATLGVAPNAEAPSGAGSAGDATAGVQPSAAQATATGTAQDAQAAIGVTAEAPGATGAGLDAATSAGTSATTATATGAALDATISIQVNATFAAIIAAAFDATVTTSSAPPTDPAIGAVSYSIVTGSAVTSTDLIAGESLAPGNTGSATDLHAIASASTT